MKKVLFNLIQKSVSVLGKLGISKKTPGALKIYNFLYRIFWPYNDLVEVQGSKMYVNLKSASTSLRATLENYASRRIHEESTTRLMEKTIKRGDTFLDLGANVGYFTLLAAKLVGKEGRVYSFEPEPQNFRYLKKNVEVNNYSQAKVFQKAVSDKSGKIKLYVCPYDSGHHTINRFDGVQAYARGRRVEKKAVEIEAVSLDDFLRGEKADVIKMDVEGAEPLALKGMDKMLKSNQNIKMFVEFFPLLIKNMGGSPPEFIRQLMEEYRFSIYVVPDDYSALEEEVKEIKRAGELLEMCRGEKHVNLYLEKK